MRHCPIVGHASTVPYPICTHGITALIHVIKLMKISNLLWHKHSNSVISFYYSLKIIPSLKTSQNRLASIDVKFIFDCMFISKFRRYKRAVQFCKYSPNSRCRPSSCILTVLAMFLANSLLISSLQRSEMFCHFVLTTITTQPRPQVFLVDCLVFWQLYFRIDVIFHILQTSSKCGQH